MNVKLAVTLALATALTGPAFAATISFAGGGELNSSTETYGVVTAYGFNGNGTATDLYGKGTHNGLGSEDGLGIDDTTYSNDNEIDAFHFISLDVSKVTGPFSLSIGSTQDNEGFSICYESAKGVSGGPHCTQYSSPTSDPFTVSGLNSSNGDFVRIGADFRETGPDNVLVNTLTYTPASPTPEPSSLIMLGTGILGAAGAIRRRLSA